MKTVRDLLPVLAPVLAASLALTGCGHESQTEVSFTNSLGMTFVSVPGTKVLFSIWETRVQDFEAFVAATGHDATSEMFTVTRWADNALQKGDSWKNPGFEQGPTHPVCGVNWEDAQDFCRWLTEQERGAGMIRLGQIYRLPTDEEWSYAVGIGGKAFGATPQLRSGNISDVYPWGTKLPPQGNYNNRRLGAMGSLFGWKEIDDPYPFTAPVGSFKANRFGLFDLGGNVEEWCEDWYDSEKTSRVCRGDDWGGYNPDHLLSSYRGRSEPKRRANTTGFRVVLASEENPNTPESPVIQSLRRSEGGEHRERQSSPLDDRATAQRATDGEHRVRALSAAALAPDLPNQDAQNTFSGAIAPASWEQLTPSAFQKARYGVTEGGGKAEITVIAMSGQAGGILANINRWMAQLALPPVDEAQLNSCTSQISTPAGVYVVTELTGNDARTKQPAALLGAILVRPSDTWFYKLMGNPGVVASQKDAFLQFVRNVTYSGSNPTTGAASAGTTDNLRSRIESAAQSKREITNPHNLDPTDVAPRAKELKEQGLKLFYEQNRFDQGIATLEQALKIDPRLPDAYTAIMAHYVLNKEQPKIALNRLQEGVRHCPKSSSVHESLGTTYSNLGEPAKAIDCFETALKLGAQNKDSLLYNIGNKYLELGKYELAVNSYQKALIQNKGHLKCRRNLALTFLRMSQTNAAIREINALLAQDPRGPSGEWAREALKTLGLWMAGERSPGDLSRSNTWSRPLTLAEASGENRVKVARDKAAESGKLPATPAIDVSLAISPFGAYDAEMRSAILRRLQVMSEYSGEQAGATAEVEATFRLQHDGTLQELRITKAPADNPPLADRCRKAIAEAAPFAAWPSDMRRMLGQDYRDVRVTIRGVK